MANSGSDIGLATKVCVAVFPPVPLLVPLLPLEGAVRPDKVVFADPLALRVPPLACCWLAGGVVYAGGSGIQALDV